MVDSWLRAPLLWPSSSRMTVFQRCHVLRRLGWRARLGGQIARSLSRLAAVGVVQEPQHIMAGYLYLVNHCWLLKSPLLPCFLSA